ncbi:hypothetical protein [Phytomonospora endophytica]|uniref:Uncharacterized protein n=1 Tax=Phytomonospora endophytica TaxID=714109 RepID=A0A841FTY4_9ACTN|nr:hypothetical protein [Phytomonospora endophytica]MBB6035989.1 hypothetical protein [Phytomonospora endophytica]GIG66895.1 hypothetical protein Pen01_31900 [Phytomonospora endophytica]
MQRQQIARAAREAGLGTVGRLHRVRDRLLVGITAAMAVPAVICVFLLDGPILSTIAFLVALTPLWAAYVTPRIGVAAKDFIAVCEGGVVVGDRYTGTTAVPWNRVTYPIEASNPLSAMNMKFLYALPDGLPGLVAFGEHEGAFTLTLELAERRPMPNPAGASALAAVIAGSLALAVAAFGVAPNFDPGSAGAAGDPGPRVTTTTSTSGPPPSPGLTTLGDMCADPRPQPGTVAYHGEGPHPVVFFESGGWKPTDNAELTELPAGWHAATVADTELVVCADISAGAEFKTCDYDGVTYHVYETRYEFRVYAAASGELVGELSETADAYVCPWTSHGTGVDDRHDATLWGGEVSELFAPLVDGTVG